MNEDDSDAREASGQTHRPFWHLLAGFALSTCVIVAMVFIVPSLAPDPPLGWALVLCTIGAIASVSCGWGLVLFLGRRQTYQ